MAIEYMISRIILYSISIIGAITLAKIATEIGFYIKYKK